MAVRETIQNAEQKSMEHAMQAQSESDFARELAQSMDLPSTLAGAVEEEHRKPATPKEEPPQKEQEDAESPEEVEEKEEEVEAPKEEQSEEGGEDDEDLVPKSKVQKRINELTREKAQLEARLRRLEEQSAQPKQPTGDPELAKLESMSDSELSGLKRQVRLLQIKNATNDQALAGYMDLEEKIDRVLSSAPQRFLQNQNQNLLRAVQDTAASLDNFEKVKTDIFKYADKVYSSSPELMGSVNGKSRAWQIATDHYAELQSLSGGKSKAVELERQVNTLKKKISVDTSSKKTVTGTEDSMDKMFKKARNGSVSDKEAYVRKLMNTDSIVSAEELAQFRR